MESPLRGDDIQTLDYGRHPCLPPFGPAFGCSKIAPDNFLSRFRGNDNHSFFVAMPAPD